MLLDDNDENGYVKDAKRERERRQNENNDKIEFFLFFLYFKLSSICLFYSFFFSLVNVMQIQTDNSNDIVILASLNYYSIYSKSY